ncbi:hypothetical protein ACU61D_11175 [Klebsiella aerogenes]
MTDITRLLASLRRRSAHAKEFGHDVLFVKLEDIDALVEALEKAQQVDEELCKLLPPGVEYMDPPDGGDVTPLEGVRRMVADYRHRIAELESRTVTVKLPVAISFGENGYRTQVIRLLTDAGIKWEAE